MHKELYIWIDDRPQLIKIRNYKQEDIPQLIDIQRECFPPPFPSALWWKEEQLANHIHYFQDGAICAEFEGQLIGSITGLCTSFTPEHPLHSWSEATDDGYIRNHQPAGNTLYIVDISVRPSYRKSGIGKWMMQSMYETVVAHKLARLLGGARMPGYHLHKHQLSAEQYVNKVLRGELKDPVITFLLRCGRTPVTVIPNYLEDEESCNYALLMEWKNPFQYKNVD